MFLRSLFLFVAFMAVAACSGTPKNPVYIDRSGTETVIRTDRDQCVRSCNKEYERCMEVGAVEQSGVHGPSGMFGASADCRNSLKECLPECKSR